ncbi:protein of unknown function [Methylorubrum extorquens]|uniref:Uncharacterized protein n=1 Tax=Methylorubrum extorquens TaxID=408 RepID=A0A2N9AID3_METEX|nr:protein of unknown function [Methylorubrum extorquens]
MMGLRSSTMALGAGVAMLESYWRPAACVNQALHTA